jgi:hypothetical protein
MAEASDWVPHDVDVTVPSAARVYDFLLGGAHNFPCDRAAAESVLAVHPSGRRLACANRAFMNRAVRFLIDQGITQFLDVGSGIPTVGNVHEIAQAIDPESRVVYVDYDAVAVAHSRMLLRDNPRTAIVDADMYWPETVLNAPELRDLLDLTKPVGLLMVAVLHFVPDENKPADVVARYRAALPPGSYVALSHLTTDGAAERSAAIAEAMRTSRDPIYFRTFEQVKTLFAGLELVEPGVVLAPHWRPDSDEDADLQGFHAGVGKIV